MAEEKSPISKDAATGFIAGVVLEVAVAAIWLGFFGSENISSRIQAAAALIVAAGVVFALATYVSNRREAGGSRAATFLLFREQLLAARSYARNPAALAEWGNDAMLQRADAEALVRVIDGTTPLFVRVDRAADIVNVLKLKGEFPAMKLVLVGVTDGWLVALYSFDHSPSSISARRAFFSFS